MKTRLRCPICGNVGTFTIQASVNVNVDGENGFIPFDESERWFGSESPCTCAACAYRDTMAAFVTAGYLSSEDDADGEGGDQRGRQRGAPATPQAKGRSPPKPGCQVYPFPSARKKER